jgi:AraC family transcriptional regulator
VPARRKPAAPVTTLHVRNMVCQRCIKAVHDGLTGLGVDVRSVQLGEVVVGGTEDELPLQRIREMLLAAGFELIEDRRNRIIEKVKHAVLKLVRSDYSAHPARMKDSEFIAREVGHHYHYLSSLFSSIENITIERTIILQRIEYAKELLKYDESTLGEIALRLGYSSVHHLSNQFKDVTGMTPTEFKSRRDIQRSPLDMVGRKAGKKPS